MSQLAAAQQTASGASSKRRLLRFYRWLYRLARWFSKRLTQIGRLVMWTMVVSGLFAIDTGRSNAYQLFSLMLAALLFAVVVTRFKSKLQLQLTRHLPTFATVDEPFTYSLRVRGEGARIIEL